MFRLFSKLFLSVGLRPPPLPFSWPEPESEDDLGAELPLSDAWLNARLRGLLGDVRVAEGALGGTVFVRADRKDSFTLGGNGLANCVGVCAPENIVGG